MAKFAEDARVTEDGAIQFDVRIEGDTLEDLIEQARAKLAEIGVADPDLRLVDMHEVQEVLETTNKMLDYALELEEDLNRYDEAEDGTSVSMDRLHCCGKPHSRLTAKQLTGVAYSVAGRTVLNSIGIAPGTDPDAVDRETQMQIAMRTLDFHRLIQGNKSEIAPLLKGFAEFGYRMALRDVAQGKVYPGDPEMGLPTRFAPGEQLDESGDDLPEPVEGGGADTPADRSGQADQPGAGV